MTDKPTDNPTDKPEEGTDKPEGKSLAQRIDAIEKRLEHFINIRQSKSVEGEPQSRREEARSIGEQIKEEVAKLRTAEKEEKGRSELVEKVQALEKLTKAEKPPESFSKIAHAFFPSGAKKQKDKN